MKCGCESMLLRKTTTTPKNRFQSSLISFYCNNFEEFYLVLWNNAFKKERSWCANHSSISSSAGNLPHVIVSDQCYRTMGSSLLTVPLDCGGRYCALLWPVSSACPPLHLSITRSLLLKSALRICILGIASVSSSRRLHPSSCIDWYHRFVFVIICWRMIQLFFFFLFFVGSARGQTQGLTHVRQVLYHGAVLCTLRSWLLTTLCGLGLSCFHFPPTSLLDEAITLL